MYVILWHEWDILNRWILWGLLSREYCQGDIVKGNTIRVYCLIVGFTIKGILSGDIVKGILSGYIVLWIYDHGILSWYHGKERVWDRGRKRREKLREGRGDYMRPIKFLKIWPGRHSVFTSCRDFPRSTCLRNIRPWQGIELQSRTMSSSFLVVQGFPRRHTVANYIDRRIAGVINTHSGWKVIFFSSIWDIPILISFYKNSLHLYIYRQNSFGNHSHFRTNDSIFFQSQVHNNNYPFKS